MVNLGGNIYWVNLVCGSILMSGVIAIARSQPFTWLALLLLLAVDHLIIVAGMGCFHQAVALGFCVVRLVALAITGCDSSRLGY